MLATPSMVLFMGGAGVAGGGTAGAGACGIAGAAPNPSIVLFFSAPAYPLEDIHDPTGAGDCFAGAFTGYLARADRIDHESLRKAVIYGSVIASYCVENFSLTRLQSLTQSEINERYNLFKLMSHFEVG